MIDVHCHIDMYDNPMEIAKECERLNIITLGMTNLPSHFELGYAHLLAFQNVRLALGMHPLYAESHIKELPAFIQNVSRTSYIGEIGLDFSKEGIKTKEIQLNTFSFILKEVNGKNKILSIHSRKAERDVLKYLKLYNIKSAIFHWYSGPPSLIDEISKNGYFFSINPSMIKSKTGQRIINRIPKENVLTESDGPFIKNENKPLRPKDVSLVELYLSNIWQTEISEVSNIIKYNFTRLNSISKNQDNISS